MFRSITKAALLGLLTATAAPSFADDLTFVYTDSWEDDWVQIVQPGDVTEVNAGIWGTSVGGSYQGPMGFVSVPQFDPCMGTLNLVTRHIAGQSKYIATVTYPGAPSGGYNIYVLPSLAVDIFADPDATLPFDTSWPPNWFLGYAATLRYLPIDGASPGGDVTTEPAVAQGDTPLANFRESNSYGSSTTLAPYIGSGDYYMNYDSDLHFITGVWGVGPGVPSPVVDDINGYYNGQLIVEYTFTPDPSTLAVDQDGQPLFEGDVNLDGFVGAADLNIILRNWDLGGRVVGYNEGDIAPVSASGTIGNDFIGIEDMNMVLANWGNGTPPMTTAIPEPTTLALLLGIGTICLKRGRKI